MLVELTQDFLGNISNFPLRFLGRAIPKQVMPHLEIAADPQAGRAGLGELVPGVFLLHAGLDGGQVDRLGFGVVLVPGVPQPSRHFGQRRRIDVFDARLFDVSLAALEDARMRHAHQLMAGHARDAGDMEVGGGKAQRGQVRHAHAVLSPAQAGVALGAAVVALGRGRADVGLWVGRDEFQFDLHSALRSWWWSRNTGRDGDWITFIFSAAIVPPRLLW